MELKACCKERFEPVVRQSENCRKRRKDWMSLWSLQLMAGVEVGKLHWENIWSRYSTVICSEWMTFFCAWNSVQPQRLKETGGNVDYERFEETVLRPIFQKQTVFYQPFSCRKWNLLEGYPVPYKKLNIIEVLTVCIHILRTLINFVYF